jgi:hypothetical protein
MYGIISETVVFLKALSMSYTRLVGAAVLGWVM